MLWLVLLVGCKPSACGADKPCKVKGGQYYVSVPDSWGDSTEHPAITYFHGYNSSGLSQLGRPIDRDWTEAGYLVIFPDGADRTWAHQGSPSQARDDLEFAEKVREDVLERFEVNTERWLISGFSQGGSMAWDIACHQSDQYTAFAPASGVFWAPMPNDCSGPVQLRHSHGTTDTVFPIHGRDIGAYTQGDTFESIEEMKKMNGCEGEPTVSQEGPETCETYTCDQGSVILCLHDGGHTRPDGWTTRTQSWFESLL